MPVINIENGDIPSSRAHHAWKASKRAGLSGLFNRSTKVHFNCGSVYIDGKAHPKVYDIYLKGVHVKKDFFREEMDNARLMRERDDKFHFVVDLSKHGVNNSTRKRGGYYLFIIERDEKNREKWKIERHFYSLKDASLVGAVPSLLIHNIYWRLVRYCYYGVAIREDSGGDNSS